MKNFATLLLAAPLLCAVPALANVNCITSPTRQAEVVSPFQLVATTSECSSQFITSVGYSIDNSNNWTIVRGSSIRHRSSVHHRRAYCVRQIDGLQGSSLRIRRSPSSSFLIPQPSCRLTLWSSTAFKPSSTWQCTEAMLAIANSTASGKMKIATRPP